MTTTMCKNINEEFSTNNLENSQKHILNPVYKNKIRELVNHAISNGDDISLDADGNVLCLQTKFYIRKYEWDAKIQDFVKARAKGRRRRVKNANDSIIESKQQERVKELIEE